MLARELRLLFAADRADHRRAEMLRPLAEDEPDAAGRRMHEDRVALLHGVRSAHEVLRRHALEHRRGGRACRRSPPAPSRGAPPGRCAPRHTRPTDRLPYATRSPFANAVTPSPTSSTTPAASEPSTAGSAIGIEAGAVVRVDEVQADRRVAHADLARPGGGSSMGSQRRTSGPPVSCMRIACVVSRPLLTCAGNAGCRRSPRGSRPGPRSSRSSRPSRPVFALLHDLRARRPRARPSRDRPLSRSARCARA